MQLVTPTSSITRASWTFLATEVRPRSSMCSRSTSAHLCLHLFAVIPKPSTLWRKSYQDAIFPLNLMFSIAWSLEMVTHLEGMRTLFHPSSPRSALIYARLPRALLLALPRQRGPVSTGLVPLAVLPRVGCWFDLRRRVHARGDGRDALGPAQI